MKQAISDFMIHVDDRLSGVEMASIADALGGNACVHGACVSESASHLIMVSYDSDCAQAHDLLDQVRSRGLQAEAVGW